ncbi:hypothetical protein ACFXHD_09885 [Streptomyces hydrogenans]|uniref:hypothetical protein n=1 Tax=Streptomyces hydrogenans TaxID=1873719 RepID=UPI0036BD8249
MNPLPPCGCRHCTPSTTPPDTSAIEPDPAPRPTVPTPIRVHYPDGRTQDATVHPDGRLSTNIAGQTHWSALTLDDMRRANWAPPTRIEWSPPPLAPPPPRPPATLSPAPATLDDEEHTS